MIQIRIIISLEFVQLFHWNESDVNADSMRARICHIHTNELIMFGYVKQNLGKFACLRQNSIYGNGPEALGILSL